MFEELSGPTQIAKELGAHKVGLRILRTGGVLALGFFFILSGCTKLLSISDTVRFVSEYFALGSIRFRMFVIIMLSITELLLGLFLTLSILHRRSTKAFFYAVILVAFFLGISIGRFVLDMGHSCGCFGSLDVMSSPWNALIRDGVVLLVVVGLWLSQFRIKPSTVSILLAVIGPLMVGNAIFSITNGYYSKRHEVTFWQDYISPYWYGITTNRVDGKSAQDIGKMIFGAESVVKSYANSRRIHAVYTADTENNAGRIVGWIIMATLPLITSNTSAVLRVMEIAVVYSSDLQIRQLLVTPLGRDTDDFPSESVLNQFSGEIQRQSVNGFILLDRIQLPESINGALAAMLVNALNNATYNILSVAPKEVVDTWYKRVVLFSF